MQLFGASAQLLTVFLREVQVKYIPVSFEVHDYVEQRNLNGLVIFEDCRHRSEVFALKLVHAPGQVRILCRICQRNV
ncbi:hypothetical protein D3C71_1202880 [compost metagenome]